VLALVNMCVCVCVCACVCVCKHVCADPSKTMDKPRLVPAADVCSAYKGTPFTATPDERVKCIAKLAQH
jgi:hypothetical protein